MKTSKQFHTSVDYYAMLVYVLYDNAHSNTAGVESMFSGPSMSTLEQETIFHTV